MTSYKRIIARLDCKGTNVIKGVQLEGLRVVGPVNKLAITRYKEGADELFLLDAVASLYNGSELAEMLEELTRECFIPITVGGGIRTVEDADKFFRAGADKVAINSGAILQPYLISDLAEKYGSQAVVVHIEAKKQPSLGDDYFSCFVDNGRDDSGKRVNVWAREVEALGAGEILVTSIDRDGTKLGPDFGLLNLVRQSVQIPVIGSSGFSDPTQVVRALNEIDLDGVSLGSSLHYGKLTIDSLREFCKTEGVNLR
jgi:imidazole glycerol-phosphate synthase subunit HisF